MINRLDIFKNEAQNITCMANVMGREGIDYSIDYIGITNRNIRKILSNSLFLCKLVIVFCTILLSVIKLVFYLIKVNSRNNSINRLSGRVYLLFTPLFVERLSKTNLLEEDIESYFVIGPNIGSKIVLPQGCKVIKWENYLNIKDYIVAFKDVCYISFYYLFKIKLFYPVYRYWNFSLISSYLENAISDNVELCFSNQSDRWALLFDNLTSRYKILLQHGIDVDYNNSLVKLNNIDCFYAISKESWQNSYKHLLNCIPELQFFKSTIELTSTNNQNVSILIVSHIMYIEIEEKLLEILQDFPITIYLKKHPAVKNDSAYYNMQEKYKFTYITNNIFPQVDYVISYESTLAYEYMSYCIPVYVYSSINTLDFNSVKKDIYSLIERKNKFI